MSNQIVHTICMQTSDAIRKSEGEFTMKLSGDNPRLNAVKLALGSMELPIVQWTIEEDWAQLYFSEGFRLGPENSYFMFDEKTNEATNAVQLHLPLHVNEIVDARMMDTNIVAIKTKYPHALFASKSVCMIPFIKWGFVEIICSPIGRVNLSNAHKAVPLEYLSEHEFIIYADIPDSGSFKAPFLGFLHVPTIPSPKALCDLLSVKAKFSKSLGNYSFQYDSETNIASLQSANYPENAAYLSVQVRGSELARLVGYTSPNLQVKFYRPNDSSSTLLEEQAFLVQNATKPPLIIPTDAFSGWMSVRLTPGWYAPAHRPMCTGNPLRITNEIEETFNKLHFPVPERIPKGQATSHFLVFVDPVGSQHMCPIFAGKYSADSICNHLEKAMTEMSGNADFSVNYDASTKRFTFLCETKMNGIVSPAHFSLLFNHPACIDGGRFGFPNTALRGLDSYTSEPVFLPKLLGRPHTNTYKISEIGHQKRFVFESLGVTQMIGVIRAYNSNTSQVAISTYVGQLPHAHGLQPNDVVTLSPTGSAELFEWDMDNSAWATTEFSACRLAPGMGKSGVVCEKNIESIADDPSALLLKVRYAPSLGECVGQLVSISFDVEPFNLCFGRLPKSIPPRMFGFGKGAIQWGVDGQVLSDALRIPPFVAKAVHSLDHVDYVLVYIEEGKKNANLQHSYQNSTTSPFAKLVLYPMFREERMLPRDTTLLGSESLSTFTLKFRNPDNTPYHFHNADFSFSLNFIRTAE